MAVKRKSTKKKKVKKGGVLPILLGPIIAALGSLAAGSAGIATAVNKAKADAKLLAETQHHNRTMEGKGLKKKKKKSRGKGLFLKPRMG